MKVSILVGGRFHAFNLAQQLQKRNYLEQLVTSYPKIYIKNKFGINEKSIISLPTKEILFRTLNKISVIEKFIDIDLISAGVFERKASKLINFKNTDILVGWSSFSLKSFQNSKKYDCINVLERGSSHIEFQSDLLREEYELLGINPKFASQKIIDKEKKEYELSDYICVPSEFAKQSFINKGFSSKKLKKINYGVSLNEFSNYGKRNKNKEFHIIYVGSISVRKGVIYLIKAFNELKLIDSKLTLIGDIEKGFKKLLYKNLNEKIKIIKPMGQNLLKYYYNQADVFVTCSIEEGLSMVQIQAMACGLPVICTKNSGGEDIINEGKEGFILPIRDNYRLKEKLLYLYENKDLRDEMSENALSKATSFLKWEDYGEKITNFYSSILKK